jgi:hypothetical protein
MIPSLVSADRTRLQATPVSVLSESFWLARWMPLPNEIHYADTRADLIDRGKPGSRDRTIG